MLRSFVDGSAVNSVHAAENNCAPVWVSRLEEDPGDKIGSVAVDVHHRGDSRTRAPRERPVPIIGSPEPMSPGTP